MKARKVSVITPCYNGGGYVYRLLDSILNQSYPNIEMIVIDDGSTDNSAEIIKSYIIPFQEKGYSLTYVFQKNAGQSVAINNALKLFSGEYLVWPDSDDFYATNVAISEMVFALEATDESVSVVRCHSNLLDELTLEKIGTRETRSDLNTKVDYFEDCLLVQNGFWFGAGNYMAKTSVVRNVLTKMNIYTEKNAGQNWQLMLPLLYKYSCITVPSVLYSILERESSHSRGHFSTFEEVLVKYESYEKTIVNTLKTMLIPELEREGYIDKVENNYKLIKFKNYISFGKRKDAIYLYNELAHKGVNVDFSFKVRLFLLFIPMMKQFIDLAKTIRNYFKSKKY
ncbi:glycosyl transferase family 2 [Shewanella halifaxensis HAW-EB4]|uniref:Glycosyl transferase family 2 n=1 Tax=Shewanella halifaxensis (strain HAW-EB4) TaxID=458817 RepID=B0TMI8_SHEHH|nr:glycosyltransferase family A protein [Shewanella halifaxensis]ABZ76057.1 glycosyl transferase family 2 [Shewanella halifaxensis HAW-EB4]